MQAFESSATADRVRDTAERMLAECEIVKLDDCEELGTRLLEELKKIAGFKLCASISLFGTGHSCQSAISQYSDAETDGALIISRTVGKFVVLVQVCWMLDQYADDAALQ